MKLLLEGFLALVRIGRTILGGAHTPVQHNDQTESSKSNAIAREANDIARNANRISEETRRNARIGNKVAWLALAVSLLSAAFTGWQAYEVHQTNTYSRRQAGIAMSQRVFIDDVSIYPQLRSNKAARDAVGVLVNMNSVPVRDVTVLFRRPTGWGTPDFHPVVGWVEQLPACSAVLLPSTSDNAGKSISAIEFQTLDGARWYTRSSGGLAPSSVEEPLLGAEGPSIVYSASDLPLARVPGC